MANLTTAIPAMQTGAPQASAGNAIVQEETFVKFSTKLFTYFGMLRDKRVKIMDIKERIDLDNERRLRRIGEPEKVSEGGAVEEEPKVDRFGKPVDEDIAKDEIRKGMLSVNPRMQ